jgi:uncharacterized protein
MLIYICSVMDERMRKDIENIVDRVVALVHPSRVFLFGSFADGTSRDDSDLDFLTVTNDALQPAAPADSLNVHVRNKPKPCNFVVVNESALKRQRNTTELIYAEILDRGKQVYPENVYKWIERKKLPAHTMGRLWKFKATEVDEWVRQGKATRTEPEEE